MSDNNFLKFNTVYRIFIFFLFILLLEGIYYFYYYLISQKLEFLNYRDQSGYNNFVWSENGLVEILQVIFLIAAQTFLIMFVKRNFSNLDKNLRIFLILYLIGIFYYLFEEVSWGQHIFGWQTPEIISNINNQNETNIHNISSLFNELPRNLLLIWCGLSFYIVKFWQKKYFNFSRIIYPSKNLKFVSILIIFFFIPNLLVDKFNLAPGHPAENSTDILLNIFFEIITFNFVRLSELQELLFNLYLVSHAYYLFMNFKK